jgi:ribonuclease G
MTWLIEQGIGEERALRYENGQAVAARMRWPGSLEPGLVADAVLIERAPGSPRGRARFESGEEALVEGLPSEASKGAAIRLQVTRAPMREARRLKPAQARPSNDLPQEAPSLAERLGGQVVRRFPDTAWNDVWAEAADGTVSFAGGSLHFAPTAAMTLVDIDGFLPPRALSLAATAPLGSAIQRFGLGGSIGIDFPTLPARDDRKAVDTALAQALEGWDHERTAMNGFGFVQLVARSDRPSLLHRIQFEAAAAAARFLLRQAEGVEGAGAILLTASDYVLAKIAPQWLEELARRTGRTVRLATDPSLATAGGHAQIVAR